MANSIRSELRLFLPVGKVILGLFGCLLPFRSKFSATAVRGWRHRNKTSPVAACLQFMVFASSLLLRVLWGASSCRFSPVYSVPVGKPLYSFLFCFLNLYQYKGQSLCSSFQKKCSLWKPYWRQWMRWLRIRPLIIFVTVHFLGNAFSGSAGTSFTPHIITASPSEVCMSTMQMKASPVTTQWLELEARQQGRSL